MLRKVIAGATALGLCGCGTSPDALQTPVSGADIELSQPLTYEVARTLNGVLVAGSYKAWKQAPQGVYYLGPPKCYRTVIKKARDVLDEMVGKVWTATDCGVFVPTARDKPPKVFTIVGSTHYSGLQSQNQPGNPAQPDVDPVASQAALAHQPALQGAPIASGIGAGIGTGIIAAAIAAEQGKIAFERVQPPGAILQDALERRHVRAPEPVSSDISAPTR